MSRSASTYLDHALVVCDLTQIPPERSGCRWGGGQLVSLITIHGGALLFDVNGLLDFTSVPLLLSRSVEADRNVAHRFNKLAPK